jgi:hypothetical protein
MRHLQQTVEKLAIRIASVNTDIEYQKYLYLKVRFLVCIGYGLVLLFQLTIR